MAADPSSSTALLRMRVDGEVASRLAGLLASILPSAAPGPDSIPATYVMRLAAEAGLSAGWQADATAEVLALHESQSIALSRPLRAGEELSIASKARMQGSEASLSLSATDADGLVFDSITRLRFAAPAVLAAARAQARPASTPDLSSILSLPLSADLVRAYADLSGDRNPLHLDLSLVQSLGLPERVVHGMLLAGLAEHAASAGKAAGVMTMRVRFLAPVHVGEKVSIALALSPGDRVRAVVSSEGGPIACIVDMVLGG